MQMVKTFQDNKYQEKHSQIDRVSMDMNNWPKFYWGIDAYKNLWFKGCISGYSYREWTLKEKVSLPLDTEDILKLANFIESNDYLFI